VKLRQKQQWIKSLLSGAEVQKHGMLVSPLKNQIPRREVLFSSGCRQCPPMGQSALCRAAEPQESDIVTRASPSCNDWSLRWVTVGEKGRNTVISQEVHSYACLCYVKHLVVGSSTERVRAMDSTRILRHFLRAQAIFGPMWVWPFT
jgi:hypothetical protein